MSLHAYRSDPGLNKSSLRMVETINTVLKENSSYRLTLRQLYYQLVSKDIIPNKQSEYNKLSRVLGKARMGGLVDWYSIEDRLRTPQIPYHTDDAASALRDTLWSYRLDRQKDQDAYLEVWIEKDALSSILYDVTRYYHVNLMVNRGYSSISAMYEAAGRFNKKSRYWDGEDFQNKDRIILYFGDHDPSGLDMVRDISERLAEFRQKVKVEHVALTREQIEEYNPPPNPAKITDPRAGWYISKFGNVSWELDALPPDVLEELTREHIEKYIDTDRFNQCLEKEKSDKYTIRQAISKLSEEEE